MREIKFRLWDGKSVREIGMYWFEEEGIEEIPDSKKLSRFHSEEDEEHKGYVLMQYTGLKDKNGKEIYEGDIIKASDFYLGDSFIKASKGEVIFKNGAFCVRASTESIGDLNSEAVSNYQVEIIGNRFENPGTAAMSPYHMATKGMGARQRAAWFKAHGAPANDGSVPNRFLCDGAPDDRRRRDALSDEEVGEFYHQGHLGRG